MMSIVSRSRALAILCTGLSGALLTWQSHTADLLWRAMVAGAGTAFLGAALLLYAQAIRGAK